ncbi:Gfo/Idh/MocA family protein [Lacibacterium aquatile]|uniref:Gfo/Idh/MocA family protein n=1 Tax=Lacibacterium aquatile TaxID=1168082 RepID=A0ABW5DXD4_9PROT
MAEKPVLWGVLGAAKIARLKVIPAMQRSALGKIHGLASRDAERARATAADLGIPKSYGSYEEMLADPEIEAVYNPLPNHLHVPLTVQAMEAGKHVLCEKPIALTADEASALVAAQARTGKICAEAFMVRHHPQWIRARELVQGGALGIVRSMNVHFAYHLTDPTNVRNMADIGGGGLYDIGCYAVATSRYVFGAEPTRVVALMDRDPVTKVDRLTSGMLAFPDNRQLTFTCSTQVVPYQRAVVMGDKGRLEVPVPFNADPTKPTRILIDDGSDLYGAGIKVEEFPPSDPYLNQGDAFVRAIRGVEPLAYPIGDAVLNMKVIDALFRSADSGRWEGL